LLCVGGGVGEGGPPPPPRPPPFFNTVTKSFLHFDCSEEKLNDLSTKKSM